MAPKEKSGSKRKASAPDADMEKVKKVKSVASGVSVEAPVKKRKAADEAAATVMKRTKIPNSVEATSKPKASKKTAPVETPQVTDIDSATGSISKASTKKRAAKESKPAKSKKVLPSDFDDSADEETVEDVEGDAGSEDAESEEDDQTQALLKGFESDDEDDKVDDAGLESGQKVPAAPKLSKADKKLLKEKAEAEEKPGVVYVGRIPHGFYEYEMREYFKQFGNILKLRLSRNRKTGASRHYAFIQFESHTVADIVARTMDNYLLFGHILKVKTVADEQLSPDIWKGANKRFKKVPWNKLEGRRLKQGASEEVWEKRTQREQKRRESKQAKLDAMDYSFEQPQLKSAKGVGKTVASLSEGEGASLAIENGESLDSTALTEATEPVQESKKNTKPETAKKSAPAAEKAVTEKSKKTRKARTST